MKLMKPTSNWNQWSQNSPRNHWSQQSQEAKKSRSQEDQKPRRQEAKKPRSQEAKKPRRQEDKKPRRQEDKKTRKAATNRSQWEAHQKQEKKQKKLRQNNTQHVPTLRRPLPQVGSGSGDPAVGALYTEGGWFTIHVQTGQNLQDARVHHTA